MSGGIPPESSSQVRACAKCGTELAQLALVCPSCQTLVYADQLKAIAVRAAAQDAEGRLADARVSWEESLRYLPADSRQAEVIVGKIKDLELRASRANSPDAARKKVAAEGGSWWKQSGAAIVAVVALLLSKGKLLLLGLTKLKTLFSMFAFFGVYWTAFGWPLALGFVIAIYIHEMGHVFALRRHHIGADEPLFIPGVGAFIMLKQRIHDPVIDAEVGLAGPIYGGAAAVAALIVAWWTGHPTWLAIAQITALMNLFNLTPIWQLDGSHAMRALDGPMRWGIVLAVGAAYWLTGVKLLILVGGLAVWRAFTNDAEKGDVRTFLTFAGLVAGLSWMASLDVLP